MASINPPYSTWAKAYHAPQPPRFEPPTVKKESFLFKLAILIGLSYLVWDQKISITFAVAAPKEKGITEYFSLLGSLVNIQKGKQLLTEAQRVQYLDYADRFAPVAKAEMRKFGIPASISLAHALVISNGGESPAAQQACNPFHLICHQTNCPEDHCLQLPVGEKVLQFPTAWTGYRAFSKKIQRTDDFQMLLHQQNLTEWALQLQKHFQPNNPSYAEELIALINQLQLRKFDQEEEENN